MILIGWLTIWAALIIVGLIIWEPWWVRLTMNKVLGNPQFYCKKCHNNITIGDKVRAEFNDMNKLEGRQV